MVAQSRSMMSVYILLAGVVCLFVSAGRPAKDDDEAMDVMTDTPPTNVGGQRQILTNVEGGPQPWTKREKPEKSEPPNEPPAPAPAPKERDEDLAAATIKFIKVDVKAFEKEDKKNGECKEAEYWLKHLTEWFPLLKDLEHQAGVLCPAGKCDFKDKLPDFPTKALTDMLPTGPKGQFHTQFDEEIRKKIDPWEQSESESLTNMDKCLHEKYDNLFKTGIEGPLGKFIDNVEKTKTALSPASPIVLESEVLSIILPLQVAVKETKTHVVDLDEGDVESVPTRCPPPQIKCQDLVDPLGKINTDYAPPCAKVEFTDMVTTHQAECAELHNRLPNIEARFHAHRVAVATLLGNLHKFFEDFGQATVDYAEGIVQQVKAVQVHDAH